MASASSSQRQPPPNGTRSQRSNTLHHQQRPKSTDLADDVVTTHEARAEHNSSGRKLINHYEFRQKLGRGQHGEVYVAVDLVKNREVAIKALRRKNPKIDRMNQFRRKNLPHSPHTPVTDNMTVTELKIFKEIAIMKKCRHPNVVRLLEVIDDKLSEKIYMVMEYLAGGEIKWRTPSDEPALRVEQTRRICRDVILGLEYLHHQGIIHRDIKPANLLWTADRRMVKIADFGVSHFSAAQHLSAPGGGSVQDPFLMDESDLSKFAGTPMFLAPEIISDTYTDSTAADLDQLATATSAATSTTMTKKKQPITKAIDIWAFGVTLYALLFGKLPFKADGEYQIYSVIRTEDWDVPETMGCDRLPVGGRHQEAPLPGQETEGYLVVALLDRLLQKEVKKRITLDDVKRHPWILRDMVNPDEWLHFTRVVQDSLSPTEHETTSAISAVRFRWSDTRLAKGLSSLTRTIARTSRSRRGPASRSDEKGYSNLIGTRSAPQSNLARHKSAAAMLGTRDKGKEVMSQAAPQPRRPSPRRITNRGETSSTGSMKSSQTTKSSTFEPFAMWGGAPSGRKSRRNSSSNSTPALAIDSLQVSSLTVPPRGPSRVGSPQPLTPNSACGTSYSASQLPSPVSDPSPSQPSPPERPLSRLRNAIMGWLGKSPTPGGSSAASTYSRGPSPQEASTSSLVPMSATLAPSSLAAAGSVSVGTAMGKQVVRRDLTVRRSEDAFHHMRGRRSSSGGEPLSFAMRAASWGEMRPSEDLTSLYSGERVEDALDQDTMLLGAGGVAQSPVSSLPTGSGVLSNVSSSVSLGPPVLSAAQALLLARTDNTPPELPSAPDPAAQDLQRQSQYRSAHHQHTTSPLARPSLNRGESSRATAVYSCSSSSSGESDDGDLSAGRRTPSYRTDLQRSTSQMYREEDDESSDSEGGQIPLEVRTRRPSATIDASSRPRPPSPPRRKQSQQSERTMLCT